MATEPGPTADVAVARFLRETPLLARFCSQNGWIDEDSLRFETCRLGADQWRVSVRFDEIVVKAAGCVGRRVPCFGWLRVRLDGAGQVREAEVD